MLAYLRKPHADLAALILRMGLGFLFIGAGYIKLDQDRALSGAMSYNLQQAVGWGELICGLLLTVGLLTRLAALAIIADMVGAIVLVTGRRDFFGMSVGPYGERFRPGFEYNIILILVCLALIVLSGGWFSLDHLLFGRKKGQARNAGPLSPVQGVAASPVEVGDR